jgi:hypothetical protein
MVVLLVSGSSESLSLLPVYDFADIKWQNEPNSISSSHTYVFLADRAGSEIPERSPSFGECPTLVAFEPLQLGEDVNQRSALFRSTIPLGSNP